MIYLYIFKLLHQIRMLQSSTAKPEPYTERQIATPSTQFPKAKCKIVRHALNPNPVLNLPTLYKTLNPKP